LHGKNNFAEVSKNLASYTERKSLQQIRLNMAFLISNQFLVMSNPILTLLIQPTIGCSNQKMAVAIKNAMPYFTI